MDLKRARQNLVQLEAALEARHARTHKHIYEKEMSSAHSFSDQAKDAESDALVLALEEDSLVELARIKRAFERLEDGSYEWCASCNQPIPESRLRAIPHTDKCMECAAEMGESS